MIKHIFSILALAILSLPAIAGKGSKQPLKTIVIDPGHGGRDGGAHGAFSREAVVALEIGLKLRDALKKAMPDVKILMTREADELPGGLQNKDAALKWRAEYANQNSADLFISIHLNACGANQRYGRKAVGSHQETYYVYTGKGKKKKKIAKTRTVTDYERYKMPASVKGTQTYILARDWYERKVNASKGLTAGEQEYVDSTGGQSLFELDPVQARIMAQQYAKYFFQKSYVLATYCEEEFAQVGRYSWGVMQRDWEGIHVLQATRMPSILVETGYVDHDEEERYLNSEKGQNEVAHGILNAVKRYREGLENPQRTSGVGDTIALDKKSLENPLVPTVLKERKNELVQTISVSSKELTVNFYDNGEVDGDTITVYDNNKSVLSRQGLTTKPISIKVVFSDTEKEHELIMVADNLGSAPPNTALMVVQVAGKQYRVNLSSSEEKNASVKFIFVPDKPQ